MSSLLTEAKKAVKIYSELDDLELFAAGICVGMTKISPEIILKFLHLVKPQIQTSSAKEEFLKFIIQGHLGKAKNLIKTCKVMKVNRVQNPCGICKNDVQTDQIECFDDCKCVFHKNCIKVHLESKLIIDNYPVKCPLCLVHLKSTSLQSKVDSELLNKYIEKEVRFAVLERNSLPVNESFDKMKILECPIPGCKNKMHFNLHSNPKYFCLACKNHFCTICKVKYHENLTCEQYQNNMKAISNRMVARAPINQNDFGSTGCSECGKNLRFCRHKQSH
jgi:hypothetical protein